MHIAKQKTGYGHKCFFLCPLCGARVQYMYILNNVLRCRHCSPQRVYKSRTDVYPGAEKHLTYLMYKIARQNNIDLEFPFDYMKAIIHRPKYTRYKKWDVVLRQLQTLENMRFSAIFLKNRIDTKTIKYYLNDGIYDFSLNELKNAIISWGHPARFINDFNIQDVLRRDKGEENDTNRA